MNYISRVADQIYRDTCLQALINARGLLIGGAILFHSRGFLMNRVDKFWKYFEAKFF